jgi:hypothetical protein
MTRSRQHRGICECGHSEHFDSPPRRGDRSASHRYEAKGFIETYFQGPFEICRTCITANHVGAVGRLLMTLSLIVILLVAAGPAAAALDEYGYTVTGATLFLGDQSCGGRCIQVVAFSFTLTYVPFVPDLMQGDWESWTHRAIVRPSTDVTSVGPLGPFTLAGADYAHAKSISHPYPGDGPSYIPFVSPFGSQIDLMAAPLFTATPWESPSFNGARLRACPSPTECAGMYLLSWGDAQTIVRPTAVPEPETLVLMGAGFIIWLAFRGRRSDA